MTPANSTAPQEVSPLPSSQQYKEDNHLVETTSPILASSSYCTRNYYNIDSPALFWNLPPPTWNLDDDTLEPPPLWQKPKCQKNKKKAQPLKHKYTHTTFCWDPLCTFHR